MAAAVEVGCDNCVGGTEDDGGISGGMLSVDNGGCNCCVEEGIWKLKRF